MTEKVAPGTAFEPIFAILDVAETIAVGLSFARALGWSEEETTLRFAFRWSRLAGRGLISWAYSSYFSLPRQTGTDVVTTSVELPLEASVNSIAPAVEAALRPLFAEFAGFEFPTKSIEQWVQKLIERRL
ncbi:hypothetical protein [Bradyrhizobium iriomotense]|uniref:hypothetical protein n=1 Tax=Bradyrhizobium iriomotense TaxID=441950 RepID=UPI001B8A6DD0|nr:hypothetical protein [Bradyrhizobium iriomotense]MBR0783928.1 hypothetical protein [Bradyrhizobium iriomotense]